MAKPIESGHTKSFHELTYEERAFYFEWMDMLIEDGRIPEDISQEDYMAKIYRMVKADQHQPEPRDWNMFSYPPGEFPGT
jgi:hypothetical protein